MELLAFRRFCANSVLSCPFLAEQIAPFRNTDPSEKFIRTIYFDLKFQRSGCRNVRSLPFRHLDPIRVQKVFLCLSSKSDVTENYSPIKIINLRNGHWFQIFSNTNIFSLLFLVYLQYDCNRTNKNKLITAEISTWGTVLCLVVKSKWHILFPAETLP